MCGVDGRGCSAPVGTANVLVAAPYPDVGGFLRPAVRIIRERHARPSALDVGPGDLKGPSVWRPVCLGEDLSGGVNSTLG